MWVRRVERDVWEDPACRERTVIWDVEGDEPDNRDGWRARKATKGYVVAPRRSATCHASLLRTSPPQKRKEDVAERKEGEVRVPWMKEVQSSCSLERSTTQMIWCGFEESREV